MLLFHIDLNFVNLREDYLRTWIHRLADMGYTGILWELEDKVQWETCPECVWPEALSKQTFRSLLAEARSRGLDNMPLLQTIGHAEYVLKHEPYHGWREDPNVQDCYCVCKPEVRAFLARWIEEYIELFGELEHFHLGGDEAYRFGTCPTCCARIDEVGYNGLYAEHIHELAEPIRARGIRPGIWCDMVLKNPGQIGDVPSDFVIWDWNYWDGDCPPPSVRTWSHGSLKREEITADVQAALPEVLDENGELNPFHTANFLKNRGLDVILCSATRSHGDCTAIGRYSEHAPNVVGAALKTHQHGLAGTLVTSWAIRINPFEVQWPFIHMAVLAYRDGLGTSEAEERMSRELFGMDDDRPVRMLKALGHPIPFACRHEAGIQVKGLKDPVPAEPGLTSRYFARWSADGGAELADKTAQLASATAAIAEGVRLLEEIQGEATAGHYMLQALAQAAAEQQAAIRAATAAFAIQRGESVDRAAAYADLLAAKGAFERWIGSWMTPDSAALVAGLSHDELLYYINPDTPDA